MYVEVDEKSRDGNIYMLNRHNTGLLYSDQLQCIQLFIFI